MNKEIKKIIIAASCIAISIVFAVVVHLIGGRELGVILSPMHIPVFIGGMILGWKYGFIIGFLTPFVSYLFRGMPPIMPTGVGMALELGTYGLIAGLIAPKNMTKNKIINLYIALIIGMIAGRIIYGLYNTIYFAVEGGPWSWSIYFTSVFVKPIIGIAIQLAVIPGVVFAINKAEVVKI